MSYVYLLSSLTLGSWWVPPVKIHAAIHENVMLRLRLRPCALTPLRPCALTRCAIHNYLYTPSSFTLGRCGFYIISSLNICCWDHLLKSTQLFARTPLCLTPLRPHVLTPLCLTPSRHNNALQWQLRAKPQVRGIRHKGVA